MGNKLRDDDLQMNIIVNGDKGKKELGELEKSTRELTNANKELRQEKQKLERAGKQESDRYKEITNQIKENNKTIKTNETRMAELRKEMGLTGLTLKQLRSEQIRLKRLMDSSTLNTPQWKIYREELSKVEAQIGKVAAGSRTMQLSMGKLADGINRYYNMAVAFIAVATGVVFSLAQWTKGLVGLDDQLADVMKTTGMTRREVREMYTDFRFFNTRTPRKELLLLAEEAGRLGKTSRKDVQDFVEVANKIKVALGDDLGGEADVALREVGKLTEIFQVGEEYGTDFKVSMEKVGSGINTVANNSNASAGYLIEYMKRLGGVSIQAKIGAADIMGYAATLDQLGQNVEMSATAQSKIIVDMFTDTSKYARIAKMEVAEFSKLLKTDANEAFIKFLEGLNGNNEGFTVMAAKLDELGIDGARAVQVLAALSSNTEMLRGQQALANKAMEEGTSLTNEYNIKNNNLAGSFAKIGQFIHSKFVNSGFISFLENTIAKTAEWIKQPVAEMLQKEQLEVNMLVMQLTNLETKESDRITLLNKLKEIQPDIVAGIDAEALNVQQLTSNLEKYNEEMAKRIVLANLQEEEQKKLNDQARSLQKKTDMEYQLGETILATNKEIALSENTLIDKYKLTKQYLEQQLMNLTGDARSNAYSKEAQQLAALNMLWINLGKETGNYNSLVKETSTFSDRVKAMTQMLGMSTTAKSGGTVGDGSINSGDADNGGGSYAPGISDKEKKENESLRDKARKAAIQDTDDPLKVSDWSGQAIYLAEQLAAKKASEQEWTDFLNEQLKIQTDAQAKALGIEKEIAEARIALKDIQVAAVGELASSLAGMFEQGSAAQIAMIAVEKAIAIAQIWMNLAKEKSAINLAAAEMSTIPVVGPGLAATYSATMTAKAIAAAKINTGLVLAQTVATAVSSGKREKKQAYAAGKYPGLQTGFYGNEPHYALFNEVPGEPEMVVDGKTTRRLQFNYPEIIKAIYAVRDGRQPAYADGKYPVSSNPQPGTGNREPVFPSIDRETAANLTAAINNLMKWKPKLIYEMIQKGLDDLNEIEQKR